MDKERSTQGALNIRIDRLVVEGLDLTAGQQRQLKAGLEHSLGQLFTERGIPDGIESLTSMARMPVAPIRVKDTDLQPQQLGAEIANSIYEGLRKQL